MNIKVFPELDSLSRAAMDETLGIVRDAVAKRGRFAIALSGGHTPKKMYELWATKPYRDQTPWDRVHLFWGDERYVAHDDSLSNFRMTRESLISYVPIPPANVHPVPTVSATPDKSAQEYEEELRDFFGAGQSPAFDLVLLGTGPEGHTASLFPGAPAVEEKQRWVLPVTVKATPPQRITLTLVVLNQARNTLFLVSGKDKRAIIGALRAEPDSKPSQYPAGRVQPAGPVHWFLDQAALG